MSALNIKPFSIYEEAWCLFGVTALKSMLFQTVMEYGPPERKGLPAGSRRALRAASRRASPGSNMLK